MISDVHALSGKLIYWENKIKNGDLQHFQETKNNYSESYYGSTNHINIIKNLRSKFKRRFYNDFKILVPVAQFIILNPC